MADDSKNPYAKKSDGVRGGSYGGDMSQNDLIALAQRVGKLEKIMSERELQKVYEDKELVRRNTEIDKRFYDFKEDVFKRINDAKSMVRKLEESINGSVSKALWIAGGTVIAAVVGWMLTGGLNA